MLVMQELDNHNTSRRHQHVPEMQHTCMHQHYGVHDHQGSAKANPYQAQGQTARPPKIPAMGSLRDQQLPPVQRTNVPHQATKPKAQRHTNTLHRNTNLHITAGTANARINRHDKGDHKCMETGQWPEKKIKESRSTFLPSPSDSKDDCCMPQETAVDHDAIYELAKIVMYMHLPAMPHAVCMSAITGPAVSLCMRGQKHVRVSYMWSFVSTQSRNGDSTLFLVAIFALEAAAQIDRSRQ